MIDALMIITALIAAYGLGSIPFGLILTKYFANTDVTQHGSGNIGATNVNRICGKKLGALTLLLDMAKGVVATLIGQYAGGQDLAAIASLLAVGGHMYSYWLHFKGGKGVATALGCYAILSPAMLWVACMVWLFTYYATRISSVASIMMASVVMVLVFLYTPFLIALAVFVINGFVIARHKDNIMRLLRGQEA